MPFDFAPVEVPTTHTKLRKLRRALTEPFPPGFTWDYENECRCAVGLARCRRIAFRKRLSDLSMDDIADELGIDRQACVAIFYTVHDDNSPAAVVARIDDYLARQ